MGKIYNLKQFSEKYAAKKERYEEQLFESLNTLHDFYDKINEHMINLAVMDKWEKWNADKAVGFSFIFTDEMLADTGDENINDLFYVYKEIYSTIESLCIRNRISFKDKNGENENAE